MFIVFSISLYAQSNKLEGTVSFENSPLELANITINELKIGVSTDRKGVFSLPSIPEGTFVVEVSILGFETIKEKMTFKNGQVIKKRFEMTPSDMSLDEVVVVDIQSGLNTRTPYSIAKIDAKGIEKKGNPSGIMGLVMDDPAVYGAEMGQGIVKPFIRGLGFSRVVTIYQSAKIENHQWGADHGLGLNDLGVGSIDIIKGPASILYGSGALGGVLLVKDDESYFNTNQITGNIGTTFNSVSNGYRTHFSVGKSFDRGFFVAADAAYESHADYKDGSGRLIGNSRYNNTNFRFHTGINKKNFSNKLSYTFLDQNLGIIGDEEMEAGMSMATTRNDRAMQLPFQKVSDHIISYRQTTQHDLWDTALSVSYQINDRQEVEENFNEVDLGLNQSHLFFNARASHQTTKNFKNTFGVQGSFIYNQNLKEAKEILIPDARSSDMGIYYMGNLELGDYFFQGGIRYDFRSVTADASAQNLVDYGFILPGEPDSRKLTKDFSGFTGSLGVSRKINTENTIKLNASTGFRAPDLAELFSNGPHPGTNRFERGNAEFEREQSYQMDVNWIYTSSKFRTSLAFFGNSVENFIFFTDTNEMTDDGMEIWGFLQTKALLYGTEMQLGYHPFGDNRLSFTTTVNIIRGEDVDNNRNLTFIPANNYSFRADYKPFQGKSTNTFLQLRMVDRQDLPGLNEEVTSMYALLNAGINHEFTIQKQKMVIGLTGNNLLNRVYVDHMSILRAFNIPHAGRNIMINAQYRF
jgi:iron complex outermembrane receptor protein